MDLGNVDSMLYSSGVLTLNNAITMFSDNCVVHKHHKILLVSN